MAAAPHRRVTRKPSINPRNKSTKRSSPRAILFQYEFRMNHCAEKLDFDAKIDLLFIYGK